ncbi:MAG: nucleotidyltransferase domain-containing protein [Campylobacter sp.]|nr:nucleotidyltransferase domain-containing protein [Campylobacter sp.]
MTNKQSIIDYLTRIKPRLVNDGILKLGLFGSYARDEAGENSDIDITIETGDKFVEKYKLKPLQAFSYLEDIRREISSKFGLYVDICDTASMPKDKQKKILRGAIYV